MSHIRFLNLIAFALLIAAFTIVGSKLTGSRELNRSLESHIQKQMTVKSNTVKIEVQPEHYTTMARYKQILEEEN